MKAGFTLLQGAGAPSFWSPVYFIKKQQAMIHPGVGSQSDQWTGIQVSGLNSWKSWASVNKNSVSIHNKLQTNKCNKHTSFPKKKKTKNNWSSVENTQAVISVAYLWAMKSYMTALKHVGKLEVFISRVNKPNVCKLMELHPGRHNCCYCFSWPSQNGVCRSDSALEACAWLVQILESWLGPSLWPSPVV